MQQIKGLTLHRPWGNAITDYGKDIENRAWSCPLACGDYLAIHNGAKWDNAASDFIREITGIDEAKLNSEEIMSGAIIAVVEFAGNSKDLDPSFNPWFTGPIGWRLRNVVKIDPVRCKGQQGLWNLPDDVLAKVRNNYKEALAR
jgi:hypothetical protein